MLELLFRGFFEWIYGLILECWEYFSSVLFDLMSLDFAYLETYMPIITTIRQIMLGVGWALLLGNLVFQATRSMVAGIGFEADDPKLLFTRTFVFSFLLVASPQICDICLNMTSVIIDMVQMPDAAAIKLPSASIRDPPLRGKDRRYCSPSNSASSRRGMRRCRAWRDILTSGYGREIP